MATTKAPLFGLDASGTIAGALVWSKWKGRNYIRRHAVPANPKSGLQVGMRSVMKFISQDYTNLLAADIADWQALATADNITPLNAQVRDAGRRARINLGWRENTTDAELTTIDPPTAPTATALPKAIDFSWTRPVANPGNYSTAIYMSTTGVFTRDISNLVAIVAVATLTITIFGLVTGTEYFLECCETTTAGELGTASAEDSATPT